MSDFWQRQTAQLCPRSEYPPPGPSFGPGPFAMNLAAIGGPPPGFPLTPSDVLFFSRTINGRPEVYATTVAEILALSQSASPQMISATGATQSAAAPLLPGVDNIITGGTSGSSVILPGLIGKLGIFNGVTGASYQIFPPLIVNVTRTGYVQTNIVGAAAPGDPVMIAPGGRLVSLSDDGINFFVG